MGKAGAISDDGEIEWREPVYTCKFVDGALVETRHQRTTKHVCVVVGAHITPAWKMDFPWSVMRAAFVLAPYPPVNVHVFFSKGEGPHQLEH